MSRKIVRMAPDPAELHSRRRHWRCATIATGVRPRVDESRDPPITGVYPTCSVCGRPQVFRELNVEI